MITMAALPKTPGDWAGHYRQSYWEVPVALRNSTLIGTPHYDNPDLYDWVVSNRDRTLENSALIVGDTSGIAEAVAAGMVLDLIRQPGVYKRYLEAALAWTDEGQVQGIWRADADEREFLLRANILVAQVPHVGARSYDEALGKLLQARGKRHNHITVLWTDEESYGQHRDVSRFGQPIFVNAG